MQNRDFAIDIKPEDLPEWEKHWAEITERDHEELREAIRSFDGRRLVPTNVEVGQGASVHYWSDTVACTIIKVTKTTITLQRDKATLDPNFKPEWVSGGFCGHCTNQDEQTYTYERDPNGQTYTFHWSKKWQMYGQPNDLRAFKGRHEFYDYNF